MLTFLVNWATKTSLKAIKKEKQMKNYDTFTWSNSEESNFAKFHITRYLAFIKRLLCEVLITLCNTSLLHNHQKGTSILWFSRESQKRITENSCTRRWEFIFSTLGSPLPLWETGRSAGSKRFPCVQEGADRGLPWRGSALPCTPHPQSQYPSLAMAANPWHTRVNAPHLPLEPLTQLVNGRMTGSPTWRNGPGRPRVFKAEQEASMCLDLTSSWNFCQLHTIGNRSGSYVCFFLSFFFSYCPLLWIFK